MHCNGSSQAPASSAPVCRASSSHKTCAIAGRPSEPRPDPSRGRCDRRDPRRMAGPHLTQGPRPGSTTSQRRNPTRPVPHQTTRRGPSHPRMDGMGHDTRTRQADTSCTSGAARRDLIADQQTQPPLLKSIEQGRFSRSRWTATDGTGEGISARGPWGCMCYCSRQAFPVHCVCGRR